MTQESAADAQPVVELQEVTCTRDRTSLRKVSLRFAPASFNVLVGDAGAGLLLRLASLLESPESGDVRLFGKSTAGLEEGSRTALRSRHFGFLFSSPCLLPGLSAAENLAMPLFKILEMEPTDAAARTSLTLEFVGLQSVGQDDVDDLSRFDQQRLALARALAHRPAVLVLDRADSGLETHEAAHLLELIRRSREEFGVTVLTTFSTETAARRSDRVLAVEGGVVCRDTAFASEPESEASSAS